MNHIAPITVNFVSVYKPEDEEMLNQIFNRIFVKAKQNIILRNNNKKVIDDEYKQK